MMSVIFAVESFSFAVYTGKETGVRSQESGDRSQEAGGRRRKAGVGEAGRGSQGREKKPGVKSAEFLSRGFWLLNSDSWLLAALYIQILHIERVVLDELASRRDLIAHE